MIVGSYFQGDSTRIGWIQHDCYREALHIMVDFAIDKHCHAERVVDVRTELSDLRDEMSGFDHRTLQWLHDCIAAAFRMEYCLNADFLIYKIPDPHTPEETVTLWLEFLRKELERVFAEYLQLPRLMLTAALYPNPNKKGMAAEDEIYELTRRLYTGLKMNHARHEKNIVGPSQGGLVEWKHSKPKQTQPNSQLDQEILLDGMTLAVAYFESGVHDFSHYATMMIDDLGSIISPYLLSFWESIRDYPGLDTSGMTDVQSSRMLYEKLLLKHELGLSIQMVANTRLERQKYKD